MTDIALQRVTFAAPVLDPGGRSGATASSFHAEVYDLALDRETGLVAVTHRATRRTTHANVPCSWEALPVRVAPAPAPTPAEAPKRKAAK